MKRLVVIGETWETDENPIALPNFVAEANPAFRPAVRDRNCDPRFKTSQSFKFVRDMPCVILELLTDFVRPSDIVIALSNLVISFAFWGVLLGSFYHRRSYGPAIGPIR